MLRQMERSTIQVLAKRGKSIRQMTRSSRCPPLRDSMNNLVPELAQAIRGLGG
jgi:hypothetical protein